jgi:hypothetical protein
LPLLGLQIGPYSVSGPRARLVRRGGSLVLAFLEGIMARYIINRRSHIYHDRFLLTEKCNTDDAHSGYHIVETDSLDPAVVGTALLTLCKHCAKQSNVERPGV